MCEQTNCGKIRSGGVYVDWVNLIWHYNSTCRGYLDVAYVLTWPK